MARRKAGRSISYNDVAVEDVVGSAFSELEELASEMREAYDNTPESLQEGGVGEARGEAADLLEGISEPDCGELDGEHLVLVDYTQRSGSRLSRSDRRDNATEALRQAEGTLDRMIDLLAEPFEGEDEDDEDSIDEREARDEVRSTFEQLRDEVSNMADEAEQVYFPGMYG